jgi:hypothetical protein
MKKFSEMTREELRKEASIRGIKNYITMSNLKLIETLEEYEARKNSVADQLGQDVKSKCDQATEFYDQLAAFGACDLYARVDAIVDDRDMKDLEESELDAILSFRENFNPDDFKKRTVETDKSVDEKPVEKKAKKQSVTEKRNGVISLSNPLLPQIKQLLSEGKKKAEIATILGKSNVYIYKCVKAIEASSCDSSQGEI